MRRVLTVLFATVAGLVLVFSFHTEADPTTITAPTSGQVTPTSPAPSAPSSTGGGAPRTGGGEAASTTTGSTRTLTGTLEQNRYGPVQVRITVKSSGFVDITALQLPSDRAHSQQLSARAGPILRAEALHAQSARIHVVSGATFTSESYAQSLQSALDQAGIGG